MLALTLVSGLASASELNFVSVRVTVMEQVTENTYRVELQRSAVEAGSMNICSPAVLTVEYSWPWWRSGPTKQDHWQAVGFLLHASQTKTEIQFGGVGRVKDTDCSATVKALSLNKGAVVAHF